MKPGPTPPVRGHLQCKETRFDPGESETEEDEKGPEKKTSQVRSEQAILGGIKVGGGVLKLMREGKKVKAV